MAGLVFLWNQSGPSQSSGTSPGVALPFDEDRKNERYRMSNMDIAILFIGGGYFREAIVDQPSKASHT